MNNKWLDLIQKNKDYSAFLALMGSLSNLFSESNTPFIHYRVVENLFCKCFDALNLARCDTSFDAKLNDTGIGIKTFLLGDNKFSLQKVAEFDKLSNNLESLTPIEIAQTVGKWRNERILFANRLHAIKNPSIYHIVGRSKGNLKLFCTPYDMIDIDGIRIEKESPKSIIFNDHKNLYNFNIAKSTLLERFIIPQESIDIPVTILSDPYEILRRLLDNSYMGSSSVYSSYEYVILPLYSRKGETFSVCEKSGLNQWNAKGRPRDPNEVYVPIPIAIHREHPNFFPPRDMDFKLKLPNGNTLTAKVCQDNAKALMSNPNKDLGKWLLRDVFHLEERELLTMDKLNRFGIDSLIIIKEGDFLYRAEISTEAHFESFIHLT